jgi:hypothetical protein
MLKDRNTNGKNNKPIIFLGDRMLNIEVDEEVNEYTTPSAIVNISEDEPPVLYDRRLRLALVTRYRYAKVKLRLSYHSTSYHQLVEWKDQVEADLFSRLDRYEHDVQYHYSLPDETHALLAHIHELSENIAGVGDDLSAFIKRRLDQSVLLQGEVSNQIILANTQKVTGYISRDDLVNIEQGNGEGQWVGTLSYDITYRRPYAVRHIIPNQVHQQILDVKYLPIAEVVDETTDIKLYKNHLFNGYQFHRASVHKEIRIPAFDHEEVADPPPGYKNLWSALIQLESPDPHVIADLISIPDICMAPWVYCYLFQYADVLAMPYRTPLLLSLSSGGERYHPEYLDIDEDLIIRTTDTLDLRKIYHISLALVSDINLLDGVDICHGGCKGDELLIGIDSIRDRSDLSTEQEVMNMERFCRMHHGYNLHTVMSAMIETFRVGEK